MSYDTNVLSPQVFSGVIVSLILGWIVLCLFRGKKQSRQEVPSLELKHDFGTMPSTNESGLRTFTSKELALYDGSDPNLPIYLAIKRQVFDVTKNAQMYRKPAGYSVFTGKDASRALGKSSLDLEDCVADYSGLTEDELETLDKWLQHYEKKYVLVGHLVD